MKEDSEELKRELIDAAKNWLAIDGLWFWRLKRDTDLILLLNVILPPGKSSPGSKLNG